MPEDRSLAPAVLETLLRVGSVTVVPGEVFDPERSGIKVVLAHSE